MSCEDRQVNEVSFLLRNQLRGYDQVLVAFYIGEALDVLSIEELYTFAASPQSEIIEDFETFCRLTANDRE